MGEEGRKGQKMLCKGILRPTHRLIGHAWQQGGQGYRRFCGEYGGESAEPQGRKEQ